jgi:hypothetical protein
MGLMLWSIGIYVIDYPRPGAAPEGLQLFCVPRLLRDLAGAQSAYFRQCVHADAAPAY